MRDMITNIALVLGIIYMIILWIGFHKHFFVIYWDFGAGLGRELFVCAILGFLMSAATLCFWPVLVIIIVGVAFFQYRKAVSSVMKKGILICSVVLSLVVAFIGTAAWITTTAEPGSYSEAVISTNMTDSSSL